MNRSYEPLALFLTLFSCSDPVDGGGGGGDAGSGRAGSGFGRGGSAITRQLYASLNHVLYNPILPFDLFVGSTKATVYGNCYRLSSLGQRSTAPAVLDKVFPAQTVGA